MAQIYPALSGQHSEFISAHVRVDPTMTVMFCAFEGTPLILCLYDKARVIHHGDVDWTALHYPGNH